MNTRHVKSLLCATAALGLLVVMDTGGAQAQRLARPNNYENLMQRARNMLEDVRALKCFKNDSEAKSYFDELHALDDAITDLMNSTYPRRKHVPLDWHIDRLDTIAQKIRANLFDIPTPCPPPDPSKGVLHGTEYDPDKVGETPPPAPPPKGDTVAPEHTSVTPPPMPGTYATATPLGYNDWTAIGSYTSVDPSPGDNSNVWSVGVRGQKFVDTNVAVDVGANYRNETGSGFNVNEWSGDAALVWYRDMWRYGPAVGYTSETEHHFHMNTWNYGGFVEHFWPTVTANVKAGGFTTDTSFETYDGYYAGLSLMDYLCDDFSLFGSVDYTHFSSFGGSGETDWTGRATWRPFTTTPLSFWIGDTYSTFSPGSNTTNTISIGVMFDLGNGQTLIESDRSGALVNQSTFGQHY